MSVPETPWRLVPGEEAWARLSPDARRALLEPLAPGFEETRTLTTAPRPSYAQLPEPLARELAAAGFLVRERGPTGVELALDPRALAFVRWLEEVRARGLLASDAGLEAWVEALFPDESSAQALAQSVAAHAGLPPPREPFAYLSSEARSPSWPSWATRRRGPSESALLDLVGDAHGRTGTGALARLLPRLGRQELDRVRERLVRRLVLFHDLDRETLELEIGFLAPARAALVAAPEPGPLEPLATAPAGGFERAVFQEDLVSLLLELARGPVKVKTTGGKRERRASASGVVLYEKARARLEAALEPVPSWVAAHGFVPMRRLDVALATAVALELAQCPARGASELHLSEKGRAHLARPREERLAVFPEPSPPWKARLDETYYGIAASSIVLESARDRGKPRETDARDRAALRAAVARPFAALEAGRFYDLDAFTRAACAREGSPLQRGVEPERVLATVGLRAIPPDARELERASRQLLRQLVTGPLVHVGGVALTPEPKSPGSYAFALTALGRVYLGLDAALGPGALPLAAEAILQPNFDVVVLGPEPGLLAELLLVAEPASGGAGDHARTLRLTRASVRSAVVAGLGAEAILALLGRLSKTGVPDNVARSVRDWASSLRRASLVSGPLLALPDEETLARVQAALGERARPLAHVLSVEGLRPAELRRKLEKLGVLLD